MPRVDIEEKTNTLQSSKHIVILGGGFAGIEVLKSLQSNLALIMLKLP